MNTTAALRSTVIVLCCLSARCLGARSEPVPVSDWRFEEQSVKNNVLAAQKGPGLPLRDGCSPGATRLGGHLDFWGLARPLVIAGDIPSARDILPRKEFTVALWATVDAPKEYGGLIDLLQDNGDSEKGWIVGYDQTHFNFGLATTGADDGDGKMTYLKSKTKHREQLFHHLVATYDGHEMRLYVDGKLEASDPASQSGPILYPDKGVYVVGGYLDDNENTPHEGAIRSIAVYDRAVDDQWVAQCYSRDNPDGQAIVKTVENVFVVKPYLQYVTQNSIVVKWETAETCTGLVRYGETAELGSEQAETGPAAIHEVQLDGLKPQTQYFYRVAAHDNNKARPGEILTFQTAGHFDTPFAFAILSDTQDNPRVCGALARFAWEQRPNFCMVIGDLVGQGTQKSDWVDEFFPGINELIGRVPLFPVIGNHENDAVHYYNYMALPQPEYYYQFAYGNAQFFIVDSRRDIGPESEQYRWLDAQLARSTATWKFVCHHYPPYSSDEDDYGDLWSGKSTGGDPRVRQLATLYDQYGVDMVWTGHIHSYERTWPVKANKVVDPAREHGTVYMVVGGGGGGLETPGPSRPFFQNTVKRGHHYCTVAINGSTLEFKAFDLNNQLFDQVTLVKKR